MRLGNFCRCFSLTGLILVALLMSGMVTPAEGAVWEDLSVDYHTTWAGCGYGGYFPIRISLSNRGAARSLTFRFRGDGSPTVTRTIDMAAPGTDGRATKAQFTLLVPCVSYSYWGEVNVQVNGRYVAELSESGITLPDKRTSEVGPAVLAISSAGPDWGHLKAAVEEKFSSSTGSYVNIAEDYAHVEPTALPSEWQAYTGLDIVLVDYDTLRSLRPEVRNGIRKWVEVGGNLIVYEVKTSASRRLTPESAAKLVDPLLSADEVSNLALWSETATIAMPDLMTRQTQLGRVYAVSTSPFIAPHFSDLTTCWVELLNKIGNGRWVWTSRNGITARGGNQSFADWSIPSVQGVPVIAFLVLITLFSIVIGPVNYFYLLNKKRLYLLVLTIPIIALITSLSLFSYSAVAHGFHTRSRVRSMTFLDQRTNQAIVTSRISLYSGLAPGGGLTFSKDSAIYPIWPDDDSFDDGEVNWTESQHFASGWLRSRSRVQFLVTTHLDQRGRLEITSEGNQLVVANGLEVDLESLVVTDKSGNPYFIESLAAGDTARLHEMTSSQRSQLSQRFSENPLAPPPGYNPSYNNSSYRRGYYYDDYGMSTVNYSDGVYERPRGDLLRLISAEKIPASTFTAFTSLNPSVDIGLEGTHVEASTFLIHGIY
ncbi:MAG: hypothetical protein R3C01_10640 [Planctomycetaceae bacterium]